MNNPEEEPSSEDQGWVLNSMRSKLIALSLLYTSGVVLLATASTPGLTGVPELGGSPRFGYVALLGFLPMVTVGLALVACLSSGDVTEKGNMKDAGWVQTKMTRPTEPHKGPLCQRCGRPLHKLHRCRRCSGFFCSTHISPSRHECADRTKIKERLVDPRLLIPLLLVTAVCAIYLSYRYGFLPVDFGPREGPTAEGALVLVGNHDSNLSSIHIHRWSSDGLTEVWSTTLSGTVDHVSFCDLLGDGAPEIIVQYRFHRDEYDPADPDWYGNYNSLLIYANESGSYELARNVTMRGGLSDWTRAYTIDYFDNGTDYLLSAINHTLRLLDPRSEACSIVREFPYVLNFCYTVGDANNDGKSDILVTDRWRFRILQNEGEGRFSDSGDLGGNQIRDGAGIGDVDGDNRNEIVMVGPSGLLSVWENFESQYGQAWSYTVPSTPFRAIQSVDLGDVDGDGKDEIVTSAETSTNRSVRTKRISIWEPRKSGKAFYRAWEAGKTRSVRGMVALRICPIDKSGREQIIGVGRDGNLYIVKRRGGGYVTKRILAPGSGCLDVWPIGVQKA